MAPSIGRIVHYVLSAQDAEQINRRRTTSAQIAARIADEKWPLGAQAHIGNSVSEGEVYPLVITRVWDSGMVNGQVMLDGNDLFWATSRHEGVEPGTYRWPVITREAK